ncbi:hypothetical protein [Flavobacterium sp.]|uniref:hypothetical protein n=1 Tax=Flavobacterium sp. TaxID=239 RepID=UPI0031D2D81F
MMKTLSNHIQESFKPVQEEQQTTVKENQLTARKTKLLMKKKRKQLIYVVIFKHQIVINERCYRL